MAMLLYFAAANVNAHRVFDSMVSPIIIRTDVHVSFVWQRNCATSSFFQSPDLGGQNGSFRSSDQLLKPVWASNCKHGKPLSQFHRPDIG